MYQERKRSYSSSLTWSTQWDLDVDIMDFNTLPVSQAPSESPQLSAIHFLKAIYLVASLSKEVWKLERVKTWRKYHGTRKVFEVLRITSYKRKTRIWATVPCMKRYRICIKRTVLDKQTHSPFFLLTTALLQFGILYIQTETLITQKCNKMYRLRKVMCNAFPINAKRHENDHPELTTWNPASGTQRVV